MAKQSQKTLFGEIRPAVLISRCLLGVPCRYHGRTCVRGHQIGRPALIKRLRRCYDLIDVCPEVDAGMSTPRPPTRIQADRWLCAGKDVTALFQRGAQLTLEKALEHGCKKAYLLRNSPACDRDTGKTALLLQKHGIVVIPS